MFKKKRKPTDAESEFEILSVPETSPEEEKETDEDRQQIQMIRKMKNKELIELLRSQLIENARLSGELEEKKKELEVSVVGQSTPGTLMSSLETLTQMFADTQKEANAYLAEQKQKDMGQENLTDAGKE